MQQASCSTKVGGKTYLLSSSDADRAAMGLTLYVEAVSA